MSWDATEARAQEPLSVTEAAQLVKGTVNGLRGLVVVGEVSGFKGPARGGHCYFKIKDDSSSLDVIVWNRLRLSSGVELSDGLEIQIVGHFDVYAPYGSLSLVADKLQVSGDGALRQKVAELARKLEREGLMAPELKRRIPAFCTRVCAVTSLSGDAINDVRRTLARRNPMVELDMVDCAVQGPTSPSSIIRALAVAASYRPDAILLVRGGGSLENLMGYNDEAVARAVAACPVPVITGIGHEPDTTICDMVADRRCSTPTGAAESVAPTITEIVTEINGRRSRLLACGERLVTENATHISHLQALMGSSARARLQKERTKVESLASHACLQSPDYFVQSRQESLELTAERLHAAMPRLVDRRKEETSRQATSLNGAGARLLSPFEVSLSALSGRLDVAALGITASHEATLARAAAQLEALSPLKVLARGYTLVRDDDGHVITKAAQLSGGEKIEVSFTDGKAKATVTDVSAEPVG